ncbi:MAG: hypothetical protein A3J38_05365 [Gammaproteobacteria bacterium RIFCSPHIGHO2_12_FULL_45_9]|nr:MAG: hypothetical protein A3J38_05365 [Gammaproteobacteria bacterium RIFCSPHIGHO2_12_FULL_45_9]
MAASRAPTRLSATEAGQILERFYPAETSRIHGRQYASRIAAFMPVLLNFFQKNPELVPEQFREQLKDADAEMLNWQRVAMLRAAGRLGAVAGREFEDKGSGHGFALPGAEVCVEYLKRCELEEAAAKQLAHAIPEADGVKGYRGDNQTLLGWMLQHATTLETLRDQRNTVPKPGSTSGEVVDKVVKVTDLPGWNQATTPELKRRLTALAVAHYRLIQQQQGFACVKLMGEDGRQIFPLGAVDLVDSSSLLGGRRLLIADNHRVPSELVEGINSDVARFYLERGELLGLGVVATGAPDVAPPPPAPLPVAAHEPVALRGSFVDCPIVFSDGGTTAGGLATREQAVEILRRVALIHQQYPDRQIGITYSANRGQTLAIRGGGDFSGEFVGSTGQGAVMREVLALLRSGDNVPGVQPAVPYSSLQSIFKILPVSTMRYPEATPQAVKGWVGEDLGRINGHMAAGGIVLGWQNQDRTPLARGSYQRNYAIGGGDPSSGQYTAEIDETVQEELLRLKAEYPTLSGMPSFTTPTSAATADAGVEERRQREAKAAQETEEAKRRAAEAEREREQQERQQREQQEQRAAADRAAAQTATQRREKVSEIQERIAGLEAAIKGLDKVVKVDIRVEAPDATPKVTLGLVNPELSVLQARLEAAQAELAPALAAATAAEAKMVTGKLTTLMAEAVAAMQLVAPASSRAREAQSVAAAAKKAAEEAAVDVAPATTAAEVAATIDAQSADAQSPDKVAVARTAVEQITAQQTIVLKIQERAAVALTLAESSLTQAKAAETAALAEQAAASTAHRIATQALEMANQLTMPEEEAQVAKAREALAAAEVARTAASERVQQVATVAAQTAADTARTNVATVEGYVTKVAESLDAAATRTQPTAPKPIETPKPTEASEQAAESKRREELKASRDTQRQEANKREEARRQAIRTKFQEVGVVHSDMMQQRLRDEIYGKVSEEERKKRATTEAIIEWTLKGVGSRSEADAAAKKKGAFGLGAGGTSDTGTLEPGLYENKQIKSGYDLRVTTGLEVYPVPPPRWDKDVKAAYKQVLECIGLHTGATHVVVDWKSADQVNLNQLRIILEEAKALGMTVEFGRAVQEKLDSMSKKDSKEFYDLLLDLKKHQQASFDEPKFREAELKVATREAQAQVNEVMHPLEEAGKKWEAEVAAAAGEGDAKKQQALTAAVTKLLTGQGKPDQKVAYITTRLVPDIQKEVDQLVAAKDKIEAQVKLYAEHLSREEQRCAAADVSGMDAMQVAELQGRLKVLRHESPVKGFEAAVKQIEAAEQRLHDLLTALDGELTKLAAESTAVTVDVQTASEKVAQTKQEVDRAQAALDSVVAAAGERAGKAVKGAQEGLQVAQTALADAKGEREKAEARVRTAGKALDTASQQTINVPRKSPAAAKARGVKARAMKPARAVLTQAKTALESASEAVRDAEVSVKEQQAELTKAEKAAGQPATVSEQQALVDARAAHQQALEALTQARGAATTSTLDVSGAQKAIAAQQKRVMSDSSAATPAAPVISAACNAAIAKCTPDPTSEIAKVETALTARQEELAATRSASQP